MRISILQKNLKRALSVTNCATNKNINLPILGNVLIKAKNNEIKFIATNLEIGITYLSRGKVEDEGEILVDSKMLSNYVSLLPNNKVIIRKKDNKIKLTCENYKTEIKKHIEDDFPLIPKVDKKNRYEVDSREFKKSLSQVVFAASNSEVRLELSGVLFLFTEEKLTLAATDSYRLVEKEIRLKHDKNEKKQIIVPAKTLNELLKVISNLDDEENINENTGRVGIYLSEGQVSFVIGNVELVSRIIEGQFPDYKQIIPVSTKTQLRVNRPEIIKAIKAVSLFSENNINDIKMEYNNENQIKIFSSGQEGESGVDLASENKGAKGKIILNHRYLLDGLSNFDGEEIIFKIVDENSPCIIKKEEVSDYTYIIMPIKK